MLTPEQVTALRDKAGHIMDPVNDFLLEDIARRVSEAGQLTSTAAYQVWRAQNLGKSQKEIKAQLKKLLKASNKEIDKLLTQAAEVGYRFDLERLPTAAAIPFEDNGTLQQIVAAAVELAQEDFTNLTQTIGMVDPFGNALPLQDVYRSCTDYAFKQVITGATDYNTAVRRATQNLANKGVRVIDYESGVHTSVEAAVRRNIMGGLGLMQEQISQANHDSMGCDGWELSAHANSAPDHEPIQGKQYTDKEYEALNNSLVRRIGTLNCGHAAFPIIIGVNEPQYTKEQLEKFRTDNEKGITYEGKHYTGYEATQMQRKIERAIRTQKKRVLMDEATGDAEKLAVDKTKLTRLRQEYNRFSKAAGLRTETERLHVAGFGSGAHKGTGSGGGKGTPGKPVHIATVDFSDNDAVMQQLKKAEEESRNLDYEVNVSVTTDGKVWRVSGESSAVNLGLIPSNIQGSYAYHNHPEKKTWFSFSADDAAFFVSRGEAYSAASDHLYEYVMQRRKDTLVVDFDTVYNRFNEIFDTDTWEMLWDGRITDADKERYHETMKILSKEYRFDYMRREKNGR